MAFHHCCSSLSEKYFPSQHHTVTGTVVQCDHWSVFGSALCESKPGDIESSTVQQGTDITVTKYIYLIIALGDHQPVVFSDSLLCAFPSFFKIAGEDVQMEHIAKSTSLD